MENQKFYVIWDSSSTAPYGGALGVYDSYELALKEMQSYVSNGTVEYLHCYLVELNSPISNWEQVINYNEGDNEGEWGM
ncbi:hypothetical protein [Iningainema tapete]|uniref:Uncharacterized protein n=1 Tax=Iningainema tapete BLCC-T55 TaxID=2748662 RepID=A0A8J7BW11_9CYAN|nr:hypothetical protein [Iningainema tapete]MBD2770927.1 hypothetical protein [Iningainema tapete BLCC-T55]